MPAHIGGELLLLKKKLCLLTHWGRDMMAANLWTTFSNAYPWKEMYEFYLKCHRNLFLRVQLTIFQHWFIQWRDADQLTRHYLNQWWLAYCHICVTRPQWVNSNAEISRSISLKQKCMECKIMRSSSLNQYLLLPQGLRKSTNKCDKGFIL